MNIKKHILEQPFIFATGLAALIHSTWSLGTIFAGKQPIAGMSIEFLGWLIPALLIAFALDIGQIVTSSEIRAGERTKAKYATFTIFALATYYLQWLYIAHHMPQLELAGGVRPQWAEMVGFMRDFAVWIVPSLLPLSTALYTMSYGKAQHPDPELTTPVQIAINAPELEKLPSRINAELESELQSYSLTCEDCGWTTGEKDSLAAAKRAMTTHKARHCTRQQPEDVVITTNGSH